jgi:hypothetical protein
MGDNLPDASLGDPAALQNTIAQLVGLVAGLQTEVLSIKNNITPIPIVPEAAQASSSTPFYHRSTKCGRCKDCEVATA